MGSILSETHIVASQLSLLGCGAYLSGLLCMMPDLVKWVEIVWRADCKLCSVHLSVLEEMMEGGQTRWIGGVGLEGVVWLFASFGSGDIQQNLTNNTPLHRMVYHMLISVISLHIHIQCDLPPSPMWKSLKYTTSLIPQSASTSPHTGMQGRWTGGSRTGTVGTVSCSTYPQQWGADRGGGFVPHGSGVSTWSSTPLPHHNLYVHPTVKQHVPCATHSLNGAAQVDSFPDAKCMHHPPCRDKQGGALSQW